MEKDKAVKCCKTCGIVKPLSAFAFRSDSKKYRNECRQCCNARYRRWRLEHHDRCRELGQRYRSQHREELAKYNKEYQQAHLDKFREYNKRYREKMSEGQKLKQKIRENRYLESAKKDPQYYERRRRWSRESARRTRTHHTAYEQYRKLYDAEFKLKRQIRNSVRQAFLRRSSSKRCHTEEIVGCTIQELYEHLCRTFEDRYGVAYQGQQVHIDHIIPLSLAETKDEIITLNHWSNLQLLTPEDNLAKSNHD